MMLQKFLDAVRSDPKAQELISAMTTPGSDDTHVPGEWCWFTDSCSYIISLYNSPPPVNKCKMSEIEDGFDNRFSDFSDSDDGRSSSSSSDSSYSFYQTESNICESGYDAFYPE